MHLKEALQPPVRLVSRAIGLEAFQHAPTWLESDTLRLNRIANTGLSVVTGLTEFVAPSSMRYTRNLDRTPVSTEERELRRALLSGCLLTDYFGIGLSVAAGIIANDLHVTLAAKPVINMLTHIGYNYVFNTD